MSEWRIEDHGVLDHGWVWVRIDEETSIGPLGKDLAQQIVVDHNAALDAQAPSDDEVRAAAGRLLRVSETGPKGRVHDDIVTVARAALIARPAGEAPTPARCSVTFDSERIQGRCPYPVLDGSDMCTGHDARRIDR